MLKNKSILNEIEVLEVLSKKQLEHINGSFTDLWYYPDPSDPCASCLYYCKDLPSGPPTYYREICEAPCLVLCNDFWATPVDYYDFNYYY